MITRPLDLAAKLRPPPRNFDAMFYVNAGLLAVFFLCFGSRFILAPGLGMDFKLPVMAGAIDGASPTQSVISVLPSGQIFADGLLSKAQLSEWLKAEVRRSKQPHPALLVRASVGVPVEELAQIYSAAMEAGFGRIVFGAEDASHVPH